MALVAVRWIRRGEVDVPFPVEAVKFWRPEVGGVWLVWRWAPDDFFPAFVFEFKEAFSGPDFNVATAGKGHVVCALLPEYVWVSTAAV